MFLHSSVKKGMYGMLSLLFGILMILVFGKLFVFGVRATWGLAKIICSVVLLPLVLVGMVLSGLLTIALPLLIIIGAVVFLTTRA